MGARSHDQNHDRMIRRDSIRPGRRHRAVRLIALLLALPFLIGGCAKIDPGPNTLSILDYYNDEPDHTLVQKGLDRCARQVGVGLQRESVPGESLIQKVLQRAASKTLPDVLMLDNPDVQQIAETGALRPLNDYGINGDGFAPGIMSATSYQGKIYALAPVVNTLGIFYNKKVLADAGVKPPKTWAELKTASKKLTAKGRYGIAFSADASYEGAWQFLPPMWTNGGEETDLSTPQVTEALRLWTDLVRDGAASKSVVNWGQGDVNDQFMAGKAAMMVNGPWNIPTLNEEKDLKWGVVQFPVHQAGQKPVAPLGGEAWAVPVTGNEQKQAKAAKFVACLNDDQSQLAWGESRYTVPTRTDLVSQYEKEMPEMRPFARQVQTARSRTGKLGTRWPDVATRIYTGIQLSLTGQASPSEAFAKAGK